VVVSQAPRDALSPDLADQVEIAADNQQITRAAQADVQHLSRSFHLAEAVDGEHDRWTLEPFEAEYVAIEGVVALQVGLPVGLLTVRLPLDLHGMPVSRREQREAITLRVT
jgi:hypothetical protein